MPLKLVTRKDSHNYWVRGTVLGRKVYRSSEISLEFEDLAEAKKTQIEEEIIKRHLFGDEAVEDFNGAATKYMKATHNERFLLRIIDEIGHMRLADIKQDVLDKTARKLYPDASPSTLNRQVYTPIVAVLSYAGLARRFKRPKEARGRTRFFRPREAERLIEASSDHIRPLITFLLGTGARTGEALSLDWEDVSLSDRKATFWSTKNGEMRGVPLSERVLTSLANLPHRRGPVFLTPKKQPYIIRQYGGGQIQSAFNEAVERAQLPHATPHASRHTWATWFYSYTRDEVDLMRLGGWKSREMIGRYVHLSSPNMGVEAVKAGWTISVPYWEQNPDKYLTGKEYLDRA